MPTMQSSSSSGIIQYNSKNRLKVGVGLPVRVNTSIGLASQSNFHLEKEKMKIAKLLKHVHKPDLMMDLSIYQNNNELWKFILEIFEGPVGVIPHYTIFNNKKGLDKEKLIDRIHFVIESGISFITIHASPNIDIFNSANNSRKLPVTSRGGALVLRDMIINKRNFSIYAELFEDICKIAQKYNIVVNLGTTFRSASIVDGLDNACCAEIKTQKYFIDKALELGTQIVLEGPGHMSMSSIDTYVEMTRNYNVPLMPLGPIVTDIFPGFDHYSSSIGAAYMMYKTKGGIINSVTRIEHKGGIPTLKHLCEAVDAATVAAQSASNTYHRQSYKNEIIVSKARAMNKSCLDSQNNQFGCSRCRNLCPLIQI